MTAAAPPPVSATLRPVRRALAGLRARIRLAQVLGGAAITLAVALAALLAHFLVDFGLHEWFSEEAPRALRAALLVAAGAVAALCAWRALARPLAAALTDADLARVVEARRPDLHDAFSAALEFAGRPAPDDGPEREFVDLALARAAADARAAAGGGFVSFAPALRRMAALAALVLAAGALFEARESEVRRWISRLTTDAPWPPRVRATVRFPEAAAGLTLNFAVDEANPRRVVVARGSDLAIDLVPDRASETPHEAEAAFLLAGGERRAQTAPLDRPADPGGAPGEARYRFVAREVITDREARLSAGDYESVPIRIQALPAPVVARCEARIVYPTALAVSDEVVDSPRSIRAPFGSRVTLRLEGDRPLRDRSSRIAVAGAGGVAREIALTRPDALDTRRSLEATFTIQEGDTRVDAHVRDEVGLAPDRPVTLAVEPRPDLPPKAALVCALVPIEEGAAAVPVTPRAVAPLTLKVEEDFGVERWRLLATRAGQEAFTWRDGRPAGADYRGPLAVDLLMEVDALRDAGGSAPAVGEEFAVFAEAKDRTHAWPAANDTTGARSRPILFRVVGPSGMAVIFARAMRDLRARVDGVSEQADALAGALAQAAHPTTAPPPAAPGGAAPLPAPSTPAPALSPNGPAPAGTAGAPAPSTAQGATGGGEAAATPQPLSPAVVSALAGRAGLLLRGAAGPRDRLRALVRCFTVNRLEPDPSRPRFEEALRNAALALDLLTLDEASERDAAAVRAARDRLAVYGVDEIASWLATPGAPA
ncbi:MAG: hypothetical protein HY719_16250, partial [Planctomycetes bacterium]|nr:hypothetical protein [Planctomycetota bacterium]